MMVTGRRSPGLPSTLASATGTPQSPPSLLASASCEYHPCIIVLLVHQTCQYAFTDKPGRQVDTVHEMFSHCARVVCALACLGENHPSGTHIFICNLLMQGGANDHQAQPCWRLRSDHHCCHRRLGTPRAHVVVVRRLLLAHMSLCKP